MTEAQTMLYRIGSMIQCGRYMLDYVIVNDSDIKAKLAEGWSKQPEEAQAVYDAEEETRLAAEKEARDAATAEALQKQIDANQAAIDAGNTSGNGTAKNPRQRQPRRTAADKAGDLGADQTNSDGTNPDADDQE